MTWLCPRPCGNKTADGYCGTSWCINPIYSNIGTANEKLMGGLRKTTNADRIRSMTDEELAEWIERIRMLCANDGCGRACPLRDICYSKADTPLEALDWLKEEAK